MTSAEQLKNARDAMLRLHKILVDHERRNYEGMNGPVNSGQFLNLLLEERDFAWLRKFSTLIVDIDEMFAQRDGFGTDQVKAHLEALRKLIGLQDQDQDFVERYQRALQSDTEAASTHGELRSILAV